MSGGGRGDGSDGGDAVRIALVQQRAGEDRAENLARGLEAMERAAGEGASVVAFAELAFERFHPRRRKAEGEDVRELAEEIPGPTVMALRGKAEQLGVVVVTNLFERTGTATFDTSVVIDADGSMVGRTRMAHITDYPGFHEQDYYAPGDTGCPVFETSRGRIGVAICYDRHFPEYMRALALGGAEIVFIPQAGVVDEWPEGLYEAEVRVAAFQNGYWAALSNRVGVEGELEFAGESFVCDPEGVVTARAGRGEETILLADVDLGRVKTSHARRLFMRHRRPELYREWFGA